MAQKGVINELVNDKVFTDEERLLAGLKALNDEFNVSIRNAKLFSDSLAGAKSLKQLNTDSAKAAQELEKLKKITIQVSAETDKAAIIALRREAATNRAAQADDKAAQKAAKLKSEYEQLNAEHIKLRANAQNIGVVFGTNSKQFIEAAKNANVLDAKLKDIDKQLGKSNRFVGEYERGNRGLSNSINQLTRELPAFTFSAQTGFLALSNNIPIFFDQIKQTREEITRLREAGEKAPSLFKQLAGSLLSFGTVLSVGVTLLTIYGKEIGGFFSSLFKGTKALDAFAERQKIISEAFKDADFKSASKNFTELTTNVNLAKEGFLSKSDVLKQYNKEFGDSLGKAKSFSEAEDKLNGKADAFIQLTYLKAKAQAALGQAMALTEELANKSNEGFNFGDALKAQFSSLKNFFNPTGGGLFADAAGISQKRIDKEGKVLQKRIEFFTAEFKKTQKEAAKYAQDNGLSFFEQDNDSGKGGDSANVQLLKLKKAQRQIIADTNKAIADDDKRSLNDRLAALYNYNNAVEDILDIDKKIKLDNAELSKTEIATINQEAYGEFLNQENEYNKQREQLINDNQKKIGEALKKYLEDGAKAYKEASEKRIQNETDISADELLAIQDRANNSLIINEEAYAKGEIGKAQYEKNKLDIEHEAAVASINEQIRLAEVLLDIQDKAGIDTKVQRKALSDFKRKLDKEDADYEIGQLKTVAESRKRIDDEVKNLKEELFKLGVTIVNAGFENEKNQIQERKDALTEETQREIDAVNRSIGTQQEKADKIAIIQAKAKAQQDILDLRKREVAQRQAKFDKAVALSSVIQNTYAGAARALKDYPYPFSAIIAGLVIATGLASAANIIATPIPKYAKGTDYHKGGAMIVGDAGTELVIEPNGRQYLTPDTDTYTTAPTGTKVIPNHEVIKMLAKPDAVQYVGGQSIDIQALVAAQKQTTKAIQSQKMMGTLVTKKGWARQQARVSGWNSHKRNYLN